MAVRVSARPYTGWTDIDIGVRHLALTAQVPAMTTFDRTAPAPTDVGISIDLFAGARNRGALSALRDAVAGQ